MSLVEAGHDVDAMDRVSGQTPLHMAITQGNRSVRLVRSDLGQTTLHMAITHGLFFGLLS